jgi:glutathione S-transferase
MCRELGIAYENQHSEGSFDPYWKTPEYRAINPNGLVPSIKDGEFTLWASMAINLYLARKYGSARLRPATLEQEALAWQWSFWAMTRLEVPFLVVAADNNNFAHGSELEQYFLKHVPMWTPQEVERSRVVLFGPLDVLNETLSVSPYVLGPDFSVADLPPHFGCSFAPSWFLVASQELAFNPE